MRKAEDVIESLPAAPTDRPIEQWTHSELLNENVRQGLLQIYRILSQPLKLKQSESDELTAMDIRLQRVVADTAATGAKLLANVQQTALQAASSDRGWDELLARLAQEQKKSRAGDKQESEAAPFATTVKR
jgi:hypothetical protein